MFKGFYIVAKKLDRTGARRDPNVLKDSISEHVCRKVGHGMYLAGLVEQRAKNNFGK